MSIHLTSERRYVLYSDAATSSASMVPFATAEFTQFFEGKYLFHRLCFHDYNRDVPAYWFRKGVHGEENARAAFVNPGARTLRGLMDLQSEQKMGIDPGLEFAWPRDRGKALPESHRLSESVVLSVP